MRLQDMTDRQLEEYLDRLRIANHASGRLDHEEAVANEEWKRRKAARLAQQGTEAGEGE